MDILSRNRSEDIRGVMRYIGKRIQGKQTEEDRLLAAFYAGLECGQKPQYNIPDYLTEGRMVNKARHILAKYGSLSEQMQYAEKYLRRKSDKETLERIRQTFQQ